jgi:hypothetical protein
MQQAKVLMWMLNLIESIIVGFGGMTTSESAAIDGRTTTTASATKNRNFLNVGILNPLLDTSFGTPNLCMAANSTK